MSGIIYRMRKRVFFMLAIVLLLTACGGSTGTTWQEQYDLGMQYLEEGDYSAAIVTLTAAIETEPKMAALYIARGDAYSAWAEKTEAEALEALTDGKLLDWSEITVSTDNGSTYTLDELYENAISDYEEAIELIENDEAADDSPEELSEVADEKKQQTEEKREEGYEEYTKKLEDLSPSDSAVQEDETVVYEEDHLEMYQSYEDCSEEEQTVITMLVNAAETGDLDSLPQLTEIPEVTGDFYYNGYKVQIIRWYDYGRRDIDGQEGYWWPCMIVSVRPENGDGYCYYIREDLDLENIADGSYGTNRVTDYVTCPCLNWKWNGEFAETGYAGNGYYDEFFTAAGYVVDNEKVLTETITYYATYYGEVESADSRTINYNEGENDAGLYYISTGEYGQNYWLEIVAGK